MKNKIGADTKAVDLLQNILDRAAEAGADIVELERVPGGLEIMYRKGDTGIGGLLENRELEAPLLELIIERARLRRKVKGTFASNIRGQTRTITVEEYDSFGESCFRLRLGRPR